MHELGTVFYVIQEVEKVVEENHLTQVASVTLEVGEVSGIIPYYLCLLYTSPSPRDTR